MPENLIRLCVGIEDPRDLIDDLEHSLLSSGAIVPNYSHSTSSSVRTEELYGSDREAWIVERAKGFRRPQDTAMDRLVKGVKLGLGLGEVDRNTIDADIVVSAPGKVILFGEHAVVHGVVSSPRVSSNQLKGITRRQLRPASTSGASLSSPLGLTVKSD